ncbi:MAG: sensor histidine kinase [Halothiobacillaceae bacterium]
MSEQAHCNPAPVLPLFCQARTVLWTLLLAQAVTVLLALAPGVSEDRWLRLGLGSLFVQWVTLLTVTTLCLLRHRLGHLHGQALGLVALAILGVTTMLVSQVAYEVLTRVDWEPQVSRFWFVTHNLAIAAVVGATGILIFTLHLERSQRIAAQSRAELDALQARIRPHFFFNSLNTVAELIHDRPDEAERSIIHLSNLFRAALHAGDQSNLKREIALVREYLELEHWRLGPRLNVDWQLPDPLPDLPLPALTLQPLVENAIHHGIERCTRPGQITLSVTVTQDRILLCLENPLPEELPRRRPGHGMALINIQRRLALIHGDSMHMSAGPVDGRYRVMLSVPLAEPGPPPADPET